MNLPPVVSDLGLACRGVGSFFRRVNHCQHRRVRRKNLPTPSALHSHMPETSASDIPPSSKAMHHRTEPLMKRSVLLASCVVLLSLAQATANHLRNGDFGDDWITFLPETKNHHWCYSSEFFN